MNPTKKYMLENFKELYRHSDLLELYLYDTQTGRKPDASERFHDERTNVRMQLYRATSAHGGYVVILNGNTNIHYLDDINAKMRDVCSQYALGMKICLERLTVARNRMLTAEANDTQPAFD